MAYELTDGERRARAEADRLNSILSQSSISEASESAFRRDRAEQAERLAQEKALRGLQEAEATLGFRSREGERNRDAALQRTELLSQGERKSLSEQISSILNINAAEEAGQAVIDEGGQFKGVPDWLMSVTRGMGWNPIANLIGDLAYSESESAARSKISDATMSIRAALSGLAITPAELGLTQDSAPDAAGISMEESLRRLRSWEERAQRKIASVYAARGQDAPPAASAGTPAAGSAPQGPVVNWSEM